MLSLRILRFGLVPMLILVVSHCSISKALPVHEVQSISPEVSTDGIAAASAPLGTEQDKTGNEEKPLINVHFPAIIFPGGFVPTVSVSHLPDIKFPSISIDSFNIKVQEIPEIQQLRRIIPLLSFVAAEETLENSRPSTEEKLEDAIAAVAETRDAAVDPSKPVDLPPFAESTKPEMIKPVKFQAPERDLEDKKSAGPVTGFMSTITEAVEGFAEDVTGIAYNINDRIQGIVNPGKKPEVPAQADVETPNASNKDPVPSHSNSDDSRTPEITLATGIEAAAFTLDNEIVPESKYTATIPSLTLVIPILPSVSLIESKGSDATAASASSSNTSVSSNNGTASATSSSSSNATSASSTSGTTSSSSASSSSSSSASSTANGGRHTETVDKEQLGHSIPSSIDPVASELEKLEPLFASTAEAPLSPQQEPSRFSFFYNPIPLLASSPLFKAPLAALNDGMDRVRPFLKYVASHAPSFTINPFNLNQDSDVSTLTAVEEPYTYTYSTSDLIKIIPLMLDGVEIDGVPLKVNPSNTIDFNQISLSTLSGTSSSSSDSKAEDTMHAAPQVANILVNVKVPLVTNSQVVSQTLHAAGAISHGPEFSEANISGVTSKPKEPESEKIVISTPVISHPIHSENLISDSVLENTDSIQLGSFNSHSGVASVSNESAKEPAPVSTPPAGSEVTGTVTGIVQNATSTATNQHQGSSRPQKPRPNKPRPSRPTYGIQSGSNTNGNKNSTGGNISPPSKPPTETASPMNLFIPGFLINPIETIQGWHVPAIKWPSFSNMLKRLLRPIGISNKNNRNENPMKSTELLKSSSLRIGMDSNSECSDDEEELRNAEKNDIFDTKSMCQTDGSDGLASSKCDSFCVMHGFLNGTCMNGENCICNVKNKEATFGLIFTRLSDYGEIARMESFETEAFDDTDSSGMEAVRRCRRCSCSSDCEKAGAYTGFCANTCYCGLPWQDGGLTL